MPGKPDLKNFIYWNRKLHIHIGLFLLLFIWLFSFSGLLLNHGDWQFANFWEKRKEKKITNHLTVPNESDSASIIQYIIQHLNIRGEVSEVKFQRDSVDFRAELPGWIRNIHVDFNKHLYTENEIRFNAWGIMRTLHTFNGRSANKPQSHSNWILTTVWRYAMDLVAIGLIFLCLSSLIMWYDLKKSRLFGFVLLVAGLIGAIYFVFLIRIF